jgi:hypothetical protein
LFGDDGDDGVDGVVDRDDFLGLLIGILICGLMVYVFSESRFGK